MCFAHLINIKIIHVNFKLPSNIEVCGFQPKGKNLNETLSMKDN